MEKKILKTLISFSDLDDGFLYRVDTIEYQGKFWLVPTWLDKPTEGWRIPERIICLDVLPHQKTGTSDPADFVLSHGIPKSVFDGRIPPQSEDSYIVVERPDIRFPVIGG